MVLRGVFSFCNIAGSVVGFVLAKSPASLIAGSIVGALLLMAGDLVCWRSSGNAEFGALLRLFGSSHWMVGGVFKSASAHAFRSLSR
ncbi:TMEM14 family protein [Labilithrix luteola]|uniref:TMEM14 family protein n=1 Tax=Labilithrix luteola TaxID=1391654 RepID=UPI0011BAD5A3